IEGVVAETGNDLTMKSSQMVHYIAYVLRGDLRWYEFNDLGSTYKNVSEKKTLFQNIYFIKKIVILALVFIVACFFKLSYLINCRCTYVYAVLFFVCYFNYCNIKCFVLVLKHLLYSCIYC